MLRYALLGTAIMALAACATAPLPILPPTHPASPDAPEATAAPVSADLANDDATQKTNALLKGEATPAADSMSSMPGMNH